MRMKANHTRDVALCLLFAALFSLAAMLGCGGMSAGSSSPAPAPKPGSQQPGQLAVTPTNLNLGNVAVGASGTATASLTAAGADVTLTSASSSNSSFALSGISLPLTIAEGQSAEFTVTFIPQAAGAASGTLTFASNATPSSTAYPLSGTGTPAPTYTVQLSWNASTSPNIVGYNIYRAPLASVCGAYTRLNSAPTPSTSYGDGSVTAGQSYCYATTAVNSSNQESPYSAVVEATIPGP